jgi:Recombinase
MKEEIAKGQLVKAEKGQYPGRAKWGYMHDRATRTIVAEPKRSPIVTLIFDLYESGMHSLLSLQRKIRETTGERISKAHLARMLKDRFYIGYFRWKGKEYKGIHPPLVDPAKFDRVQEVLSGRNINKSSDFGAGDLRTRPKRSFCLPYVKRRRPGPIGQDRGFELLHRWRKYSRPHTESRSRSSFNGVKMKNGGECGSRTR